MKKISRKNYNPFLRQSQTNIVIQAEGKTAVLEQWYFQNKFGKFRFGKHKDCSI